MAKKKTPKADSKDASRVERDKRTGKDAKSAAGSALAERSEKARTQTKSGNGKPGTDDPGPSRKKK